MGIQFDEIDEEKKTKSLGFIATLEKFSAEK
jgi:hypothetical protein